MKKVDNKQRLFEVMSRLDKTFKSNLNESEVEEGKMANIAAGIGMAAGTMMGNPSASQAQTTAPINKPGIEQSDYSLMNDYYSGIANKLAADAKQKGDMQSEIAYNKIKQHYQSGNAGELSAGLKPYMDNIIKTQQSASHNDIVNYVRGVNESEVEEGKMANIAAGIGMAAGTMFGGGTQAQTMASAAPMNKPGMEQTTQVKADVNFNDLMLGLTDTQLKDAVKSMDDNGISAYREIKNYYLQKKEGKTPSNLSANATKYLKVLGSSAKTLSDVEMTNLMNYGSTVRNVN